MMKIWVPEQNGEWYIEQNGEWIKQENLDALIQVATQQTEQEAVVFFSSHQVQSKQMPMNKAQYRQLGTQGVQYLLEEYVTQSIESLKILHVLDREDTLTILGVSHDFIETLKHSLSLLPVKIIGFLPDFLLLPAPNSNEKVIANIDGHILCREHEYLGYLVDDLSLYLDYQNSAKKYRISNLSDAQIENIERLTAGEHIEYFAYQVEIDKRIKQHVFNFLPKIKAERKISWHWKACAAVLAGILTVQLVYDFSRWLKYRSLANQTAANVITQFKSWFGNDYPVTEENLKKEFQNQVDKNRPINARALKQLSLVGPVMMQNQITAEQVSYSNQLLNLTLNAQNAEALQALTRQLGQQGVKVELGNIQPSATGVTGMVKIQ